MSRKTAAYGRLLALAAAALLLAQAAWAAPKYKMLHSFGAGEDGGGLWTGVTPDKEGDLYGATSGGGAYGDGIVFRLTPHADGRWTEEILHDFPSSPDDGSDPNGGLIQDALGNWYGTTKSGGTDHTAGTVFELSHGSGVWTESTLYSFGTQSGDGGSPTAGLVMDGNGNLYGTTPKGSPWSTAFKLTPGSGGWSETVLYRFCVSMPVCKNGTAPYAGLILDAAGNLYGTTADGGEGCGGEGCGTVYKLTPGSGGWKESVLHSFDNSGKDGVDPGWGALFIDGSGNLYGTTFGGGTTGYGTVFQLTSSSKGSWKESILYNFKNDSSGAEPNAGVVMDKAGNLYGTTTAGGTYECGVIYKLAPEPKGGWKYTVLHIFAADQGCLPEGNLVLDKKGNLYGGTALGGAYGPGVVFELTP
jgi:uncharacterized repeat protein (TIGR03803 family)